MSLSPSPFLARSAPSETIAAAPRFLAHPDRVTPKMPALSSVRTFPAHPDALAQAFPAHPRATHAFPARPASTEGTFPAHLAEEARAFPAHPSAADPTRAAEPGAKGANEAELRRKIATNARQLVAAAFIVPLLKELRASGGDGTPFGSTSAETRLSPVLDASLADRMVERSRLPITEAVERSMAQRAGLKPDRPRIEVRA